jgi:hypothetical protein
LHPHLILYVYFIKVIITVSLIKTQANLLKQIHISTIDEDFDAHGSVHRRLLSRNTNMQLCNRIYYSKFFEDSTCFEQHTANHQDL